MADGLVESFDNIYHQHGMDDYFEVRVVSEAVGACKPAREMFEIAMEKMNLTEKDKKYIIMIGNNLERDIVGARRMGIISILAGYSPRYRMQPEKTEEMPDYVVCDPSELPGLVEMLDRQMENKKHLDWWLGEPEEKNGCGRYITPEEKLEEWKRKNVASGLSVVQKVEV